MSRRFLEALLLRDLNEIRRALLNEPLMKKDSDAPPAPGPVETGPALGGADDPAQGAAAELPRTGLRGEARRKK